MTIEVEAPKLFKFTDSCKPNLHMSKSGANCTEKQFRTYCDRVINIFKFTSFVMRTE
jgi:hypothetical protein